MSLGQVSRPRRGCRSAGRPCRRPGHSARQKHAKADRSPRAAERASVSSGVSISITPIRRAQGQSLASRLAADATPGPGGQCRHRVDRASDKPTRVQGPDLADEFIRRATVQNLATAATLQAASHRSENRRKPFPSLPIMSGRIGRRQPGSGPGTARRNEDLSHFFPDQRRSVALTVTSEGSDVKARHRRRLPDGVRAMIPFARNADLA